MSTPLFGVYDRKKILKNLVSVFNVREFVCGLQTALVFIYRYVQSSVDNSLHHDDPEFASPGFMLAGDDLPRPLATAKQHEQIQGMYHRCKKRLTFFF